MESRSFSFNIARFVVAATGFAGLVGGGLYGAGLYALQVFAAAAPLDPGDAWTRMLIAAWATALLTVITYMASVLQISVLIVGQPHAHARAVSPPACLPEAP